MKKLRISTPLKKIAVFSTSILVLIFIIDVFFPVDTSLSYATIIEARDGTVIHAYLAKDQQWRMQTRLDEITPELKKAILFKEDKHFYHHVGINPLALCRALKNNLFHLKRTSGASTITMQVARMLEPKPRTYIGKFIEMFRALQLEVHHSKDEVLQLYLNLVPYGSNIQGVKAASLLYFSKSPDQLSLAEITALSIIPNRPSSLVMGRDNALIVRERNKWLKRFREGGLFSVNIIDDAVAEPLNAFRHSAPQEAHQFSLRMKKELGGRGEVKTTIDSKAQLKAENITSEYMEQLKMHNINNASVLIVDNRKHEVVSYIGSSDFKDKSHFGQVDGVKATRSPGSTLKPLLYGMCFDKGLATPKMVMADVPISIKGYSPENYDRLFRGNVTTDYALRNSLNIPAVKLLELNGVNEFINTLTQAGFTSVYKKRKELGLSVILGGCGVRLDELTALYSSFANNGIYAPLKYTLSLPGAKDTFNTHNEVKILTMGANYMITHILSELHRPDLPNGYDQAQGIPKIAWKTGTSYGRKDAWSIGYNKKYTIGVWLGNFSGLGIQELSGANTATPLLFKLFNALDHDADNPWVEPPASLAFRLVCSETGKIPDEFCRNQVMDYYLPGISKNNICDHLKPNWLSADEKYSYCTSCLPPYGYKTKLMQNIEADLAAYFETQHIPYQKLPAHNLACSRMFSGKPPVITSLTNGMTYLIADKDEQKLQLACAAGTEVQKVYWYINNKHYATASPSQKLFFPVSTTTVKISCTDDKGRSANISVKVKFI